MNLCRLFLTLYISMCNLSSLSLVSQLLNAVISKQHHYDLIVIDNDLMILFKYFNCTISGRKNDLYNELISVSLRFCRINIFFHRTNTKHYFFLICVTYSQKNSIRSRWIPYINLFNLIFFNACR